MDTHRSKDVHDRILHRLKIAKGHLAKVIEMVDKGEYCIDVIQQSRAVQHALKEVDALTLENHLQTCVISHVKKGDTKKTTDEIMKIFKNNSVT